MGLKEKFLVEGTPFGSPFTNDDGSATTLEASTANSKLHYNANGGGYSLNSADFATANTQYQQYDDGVPNLLPAASILDINGANPTAALRDSNFAPVNNSFANGTYRDTLNSQGIGYAGTF